MMSIKCDIDDRSITISSISSISSLDDDDDDLINTWSLSEQ